MSSRHLFALAAAATLAGTALLTSCSSITHGTITGKQYKPERQWTYMQPVYSERCTTSGRTGSTSCSSYISTWIPIPETDPACWELELRHGGDTGSVCVSEQAWNGAHVGGAW
jgi:hypothetical protein